MLSSLGTSLISFHLDYRFGSENLQKLLRSSRVLVSKPNGLQQTSKDLFLLHSTNDFANVGICQGAKNRVDGGAGQTTKNH